jgi:hypothetical protein
VDGALESSFFYDFEGRLTNQTGPGTKAITWDAKGRVRTVSGETYTYDPMDYRIGRTGGSVGAREYFLEGEHLESEYSGSQLRAKYFRGSTVDELVGAWMTDTDGKLKPFLFHQDQVTSTSAVTGHNGGTTQSIKYAAFGNAESLMLTPWSQVKKYLLPGIYLASRRGGKLSPVSFVGKHFDIKNRNLMR